MDHNGIPNTSPIQSGHYWGDCRIQGRMQEGISQMQTVHTCYFFSRSHNQSFNAAVPLIYCIVQIWDNLILASQWVAMSRPLLGHIICSFIIIALPTIILGPVRVFQSLLNRGQTNGPLADWACPFSRPFGRNISAETWEAQAFLYSFCLTSTLAAPPHCLHKTACLFPCFIILFLDTNSLLIFKANWSTDWDTLINNSHPLKKDIILDYQLWLS